MASQMILSKPVDLPSKTLLKNKEEHNEVDNTPLAENSTSLSYLRIETQPENLHKTSLFLTLKKA